MSRPYNKRRGGGGNFPRMQDNHGGRNNNNNNNGVLQSGPYGGGRQAGGGSHFRGGRGRERTNNNNNRGGGNNNNNNKNNNSNNVNNASADVMKTLLKLLFEKSYGQIFVEESGMLVLNNMRGSPDLASAQKSVDFNSVAFCKVLAEVVREVFAHRLRILQVDDNKIRRLGVLLNALAEAEIHRGIIAVSARDNEIADLSFLGALKSYSALGELLLVNNPVVNTKDYRAQVLRQMKQLKMLDGEAIQHNLLSLPNPTAAPALDEAKMNVLLLLEQTLFHNMDSRSLDSVGRLYAPTAAFSASRSIEPLPSHIPLDALHHTSDMDKRMLTSLQAELATVRNGLRWRNLATDVTSMRNVCRTREEVVGRLRTLCGDRRPLNIRQVFNPNASVNFLTTGVKVPLCVMTVHGKMLFVYNPVSPDTRHPFYSEGKEPFISCFFDHTLVLTWDAASNAWQITNDMLFLRPDKTVVHDDGSQSQALYFANAGPRIEQLRRTLMPMLSSEAMAELVAHTLSDRQIQELTLRLQSLPPEQLQQAIASPEALKQTLNAMQQQQQ